MNHSVKKFIENIRLPAAIFIFVILCVILAGITAFQYSHKSKLSPEKLLSCFASSDDLYRTDGYCLERIVKELMHVYSTDDLLAYIEAPSTPIRIRTFNHTIAHFIGKQIFLNTGSIEAALEQCEKDSRYGCLHGAVGAAAAKDLGISETEAEDLPHADAKTIGNIAAKYCASDNIQLCHAVGHILFRVSHGYSAALTLCDKTNFKDPDKRETCARGIFMESSGPTGALWPNRDSGPTPLYTYLKFCDKTSSEYQHACFRYWPKIQLLAFEHDNIFDPAQRLAFSVPVCRQLNGTARADCIEALGFSARRVFGSRDNRSDQKFCDQFDVGDDRQSCVLGVIGLYVWNFHYTDGVRYCHSIIDSKLQNFCYKALFQTSDQVSMGSAMSMICEERSTSQECNQELTEYIHIKPTLPDYSLGLFRDKKER